MQHSTIEIVKGRPYVVFVKACGYNQAGNWTWLEVAPPLDADRDGEDDGESILMVGNHLREPGLMIVRWDGDLDPERHRYRLWEEVKPDETT